MDIHARIIEIAHIRNRNFHTVTHIGKKRKDAQTLGRHLRHFGLRIIRLKRARITLTLLFAGNPRCPCVGISREIILNCLVFHINRVFPRTAKAISHRVIVNAELNSVLISFQSQFCVNIIYLRFRVMGCCDFTAYFLSFSARCARSPNASVGERNGKFRRFDYFFSVQIHFPCKFRAGIYGQSQFPRRRFSHKIARLCRCAQKHRRRREHYSH